jgi:prepilin peptidase CpaA
LTIGWEWVPVLLMVGMAGAWDLRRGIIPNWLTLPGFLLGFGWHLAQSGWSGRLYALFGWHLAQSGWSGLLYAVVGAAVTSILFLAPYLLGGLGAGDLKLALALGSLLGPLGGFRAALASAIVGGILACLLLVWRGRPRLAEGGGASEGLQVGGGAAPGQGWGKGGTIPYGVAIAIGTAWSVFWVA